MKCAMPSIHPPVNDDPLMHVTGFRKKIELSFILPEPVIYLQGQNTASGRCMNKPTVLRGYLHLKVSAATKIKSIYTCFRGLTQSKVWGDGGDTLDLIRSGITLFDHEHQSSLANVYNPKIYPAHDKPEANTQIEPPTGPSISARWNDEATPPDYETGYLNQLPPQPERPAPLNEFPLKEHCALFPLGNYLYPFEFLVLEHLPETINTGLISTSYSLEAVVEFAGFFRTKMRAHIDIPLLRLPSENSLELVEPILLSKTLRELLHYDGCIMGRSFHLGSRIPIRITLTPSFNLSFRWIRVYIFQSVEYRSPSRRHYRFPARRVLLFQKLPGVESYSTYPGSSFRFASTQGVTPFEDLQSLNLVCQASETYEINIDVQLPRCPEMSLKPPWEKVQTSAKGDNLKVRHWVEIVLSLPSEDEQDISARDLKASELTIEAPVTILSCKATPANIYVPPYTAEPDLTGTALSNHLCDCDRSTPLPTLESKREGLKIRKMEQPTSIKSTLPDMITAPFSLFTSSVNIKQPTQVHLDD